jgi:disulfide bond formation protein DsbB
MKQIQTFLTKNILYIALLQSIAALLGSLYYSEIKNYTPCTLCWYQRILMYPLVILIAVGILRRDKKLDLYILPMTILGGLIAFYHILLQKGILPEAIAPCTIGASCLTKHVGYFGFITIPVMSLTAFVVITICMVVYRRIRVEEEKKGKKKK